MQDTSTNFPAQTRSNQPQRRRRRTQQQLQRPPATLPTQYSQPPPPPAQDAQMAERHKNYRFVLPSPDQAKGKEEQDMNKAEQLGK